MNSFYLFRNSEGAMRGRQFIAVSRKLLFVYHYLFFRHLQHGIRFAFGAARLVEFRLVSVGDEMA